MHLGYLAAGWGRDTSNPTPFFVLMLTCIAFAVVLKKRWLAMYIVFALVACVTLTGAVMEYRRSVEFKAHYRENGTKHNASVILAEVSRRAGTGEGIPTDVEALCRGKGIRSIDGWLHVFRLTQRTRNGTAYFTLTSAGPDWKFGTEDDISSSRTIQIPPKDKPVRAVAPNAGSRKARP